MSANNICFKVSNSLRSYKALWFGGAFFVIVLLLYLIQFGDFQFWNYLSSDREHWGQFGDFIGGLLNPFIGLITIWLFTRSLQQNSEMLLAAKEELKLARVEIARGVEIQRSTEEALKEQIDISRQGKEFNIALGLQGRYSAALSDPASNLERLTDVELERYSQRDRFLQRYIDFQFASLVDRALELGVNPDLEFATHRFAAGGIHFHLCASVVSGSVRISVLDPIRGYEQLGYFFDKDGTISSVQSYLGKIHFLLESAGVAIVSWLEIEPGARVEKMESIPGLFKVLPPR